MKSFWTGLVLIVSGVWMVQARCQAVPVADAPSVGFQLPSVPGSLNFSLSASEAISKGFYDGGAVGASTNLSGNVAFITESQRHPFSMVYSGGYSFSNFNQPSVFFQSLAFSQVLTAGRWNFLVSDSVSYLPQTASTGLSGVPGNGDVGVDPIQVSTDGLGILTYFGPRVSNTVSGSASHPITSSLSFQASGSYNTLRFLGDTSNGAVNGLDSTSVSGSAGLSYRINARSSISGNYGYSRFSFGQGDGSAFTTQSATVQYTRQQTRRLSLYAGGGPQFTSISGGSGPTATSFSANAGLSYVLRDYGLGLNYSRGVSTGYGVIAGATTDSLTGSVHRSIGRTVSVGGSIGYSRSVSLQALTGVNFSSEGGTLSGQVGKSIGRHLSVFGAYTLLDQTVTSPGIAANAFSGVYQTFAFGLTYSPSSYNLRRR